MSRRAYSLGPWWQSLDSVWKVLAFLGALVVLRLLLVTLLT